MTPDKKRARPTEGGRTIIAPDGTFTVHKVAPGMKGDHPCVAYPWPPHKAVDVEEEDVHGDEGQP